MDHENDSGCSNLSIYHLKEAEIWSRELQRRGLSNIWFEHCRSVSRPVGGDQSQKPKVGLQPLKPSGGGSWMTALFTTVSLIPTLSL